MEREPPDDLGRPHRIPLPPDPQRRAVEDLLDSGHNPVLGTWQHLAATYDGSTARYYIDGLEVRFARVGAGAGTSDVWRIGAYGGSPGGFFDGIIDNVRVYNRALAPGEIQSDMNTVLARSPARRPDAPRTSS